MSPLKPITLHGHTGGPNPWKVVIVLEELGVPYTLVYQTFDTVKSIPYTDINPNGRVPAIEDPNTGVTLWESGAIIEYLVETYDIEQKISHGPSAMEKWIEKQFLYFQVSGQGPYYGQWVWFANYHAEKLPSAQARYLAEIKRVMSVLDTALEGKEYLVGNKATYADLSFITWALMGQRAVEKDGYVSEREVPHYTAWLLRLSGRPAVKKSLNMMERAAAHSSQ